MIDDILNDLVDGIAITNVNLVEAYVGARLLGQLLRGSVTSFLLDVKDSYALNANFAEGLRHVETKATTTTVDIC